MMARSLFMTGATGFLGRHLLHGINPQRYQHIYCLSRMGQQPVTDLSGPPRVTFIRGTLFDADIYRPYLARAETVVHMAAAVGKVEKAEYFRVNAEGTEFLIEECQQLGVRNFLYISSIAVKYIHKSRYYYAQSKQLAEEAVRRGKLQYTIVRPTLIVGKESSPWRSLCKLVTSRLILVIGDGSTRIQPIHVDDLVAFLDAALDANSFSNETIEVGGPQIITIEHFLKCIHQSHFKSTPLVLHLPLKLLAAVLSFLESFSYSILPLNVGQLAFFRNDGTIKPSMALQPQLQRMKTIDEMLAIR
jgi:nucleoside-diphosphate-sugar epimerase